MTDNLFTQYTLANFDLTRYKQTQDALLRSGKCNESESNYK